MKTKKTLAVGVFFFVAVLGLAISSKIAVAIPQVTTPVATPPGGTYTTQVRVVLTSPDSDFFLYTEDGTTPHSGSIQKHGTEPIGISQNMTLKAIAVAGGMIDSEVMTETYNFIDPVSIYRFWSEQKQGHFFTTSAEEKAAIMANDPSWTYEGEGFSAFSSHAEDVSPVYRFWSGAKQHHFYTISEAEKNQIEANDPSWEYEGIAYYAYPAWQPATEYVFRFWSDSKQGHFFTTSAAEKDNIEMNDPSWEYEGVAWYVPNPLYY